MRWDGDGDDGPGDGDNVDDDPDDARRDDDDDDNDFPLRERISPMDFCMPESLLLFIWFPPRGGGEKLI